MREARSWALFEVIRYVIYSVKKSKRSENDLITHSTNYSTVIKMCDSCPFIISEELKFYDLSKKCTPIFSLVQYWYIYIKVKDWLLGFETVSCCKFMAAWVILYSLIWYHTRFCGNMETTMNSEVSVWSAIYSWWRHQMETFYASLALCVENSPVTGEFPSQRPVTRSFDGLFDLRLE